MKRNFYSDNVSGAAPEILDALLAADRDDAAPYGQDRWTQGLPARFAEVFETEVGVYPVGTGTVANGLAAAVLTAPFGAIYTTDIAHLFTSECGGPEFWSGGNARPVALPEVGGKLPAAALARAIDDGALRAADVPPRALSLTQGTEAGTAYTLDEIRTLAEVARARGLRVHMDGARLANALAHLGCSPADMTWRAGVDLLSFGATKNGALFAEALLVFDRALDETLRYRRRRAGHLFSKMRYISAQLDAYLRDGLWLRNARHANRMAARLRAGLERIPGARFPYPTELNFVLVALPKPVWDALVEAGYSFSRRGTPAEGIVRIACAFNTSEEAVDALLATGYRAAGLAPEAGRLAPATA